MMLTMVRVTGRCCMTSECTPSLSGSIRIGSSLARVVYLRTTPAKLRLGSDGGMSYLIYVFCFPVALSPASLTVRCLSTFVHRICPGMDLAENTLWIGIASIFYAFKISPELDAAGKPVPVDLEYRENSVR